MTRHRVFVELGVAAATVVGVYFTWRGMRADRIKVDPVSWLGDDVHAALEAAKIELMRIDDPGYHPDDAKFKTAWDKAELIVGKRRMDLLYGHGWSVAPTDDVDGTK